MVCASEGRAGSLFAIVVSLKCLLTSGAKASISLTKSQTFSDRTQLMMADAFMFNLISVTNLNCGMGAGTSGTGVFGRGLAEGTSTLGAEYVFSAEVMSFSHSTLDGAGFGRSSFSFPNAISFFLACNTSMYLLSSASSGFSVPLRELSTSSSLLIGSKWAKRLEISSFVGPQL